MLRRKLLTEFIEWFAKSRRPYDQRDCEKCIAAQAGYWLRCLERSRHGTLLERSRHRAGDIWLLMERFGIPSDAACNIYSSAWANGATRKAAVELLRHYLKTGAVDWPRAIRSAA